MIESTYLRVPGKSMFALKAFGGIVFVSSPPAQRCARLAPALYSASANGIESAWFCQCSTARRKIPRPRFEIDFRIEQFFRAKIIDPIFLRPFLRSLLAHLHQTALARRAELLRVESAFAPDHCLHQHRIEAM